MVKRWLIFQVLFLALFSAQLFAQGRPYDGPEDPAGDIAAERDAYMNGNRVFLYFRNTTELSDWPRADVSRWPNTYDGQKMLDGVALMIDAKVYLENDSIPVTDLNEIAQRADELQNLYFLQTSYREGGDFDPTGTVEWKMYPVFGYFNINSETPAMSNRPDSWPPDGWPARGFGKKWPGEWNGRFGRGVQYADLETFFTVNDAQDQEYLGEDDELKYYPRRTYDANGNIVKDIRIGDFRPTVSIQKGAPWGGIGIRVETRGFQWNNPQARDAIFWEYNIANISEYDLPEVAFGYWVDNQIGNEGDDEIGFFDTKLDMAYSWDIDGIGRGGLPTGIMGFAYLESPGLPFNGIDDDEDGLVDEARDNPAVSKIGPTDGIADLNAFLETYQMKLSDLKEHWDADEDQDWQDGIDANGDGVYQIDEFAGDDVGLDGVGPTDLNYTGPDEGECNHRPDFEEGIGCEPNFNATDISESDMVGLTAFRMLPSDGRGEFTWQNDEGMWKLVGGRHIEVYNGLITNLIETFASGPFPLYKGRTERISMSILHAFDPLSGLNSEAHTAPALFQKKRIVQIIYEADYRFAQPPSMPTLKAVPGDGQVVLVWDDVADKQTREPLLKNENDFEGYKIYKATDKKFSDAEVILDGYGNPLHKLPIFQCDLIDGIKGFTDFGLINGVGYNLGYDNGLTHHFIDKDVKNGVTYYYAVVAYDRGIPDVATGIAPSENNVIIDLDEAENIRFVSKNVQVVTPHQFAAGYRNPELQVTNQNPTYGSNEVIPEIIATTMTKPGHTYKVKFGVQINSESKSVDYGMVYKNTSFYVYDMTLNDSLVYYEDPNHFANQNFDWDQLNNRYYIHTGDYLYTDLFDGIRLKILIPVTIAEFDEENSGWLDDKEIPIRITQPQNPGQRFFPDDYDIIFTADDSAYVGRVKIANMKDEFNQKISKKDLLLHQALNFLVINQTRQDTMEMVVQDMNGNGTFDILEDRILVGPIGNKGFFKGLWGGLAFVMDFNELESADQLPQPGDVYRVTFKRPFLPSDSLTFTINEGAELDPQKFEDDFKEIKVVPNPYIATNAMEPALSNPYLNQPRRLMFTHIPAQCKIQIFTVSGVLVKMIDVDNEPANGIIHWNLRSREGLEVAAGMYLYRVKSLKTGKEKIGKFAIIK
ncbi:MAG: hypothetical protein J7L94_04605 [Caldisericaceae bacterium]|nr:hypothetical protein [Caldisericaceae bacterium]